MTCSITPADVTPPIRGSNAGCARRRTPCSAPRSSPLPPSGKRAWKGLLFNQFHDILAGTSLESAYETARAQLGEARAIAGRARTFAMQAIARQIELSVEAGAQPYVVFNPNAWAVRLPVEIEPGPLDGSETLLDPQG